MNCNAVCITVYVKMKSNTICSKTGGKW